MKPDAIIVSDIHLRDSHPVCRTDDFFETQFRKLQFVKDLQRRYNCPVLHGGDLFHHPYPSPHLLSRAIEHIPDRFLTVGGQHDLPRHNMELIHKSGLHTLRCAGRVELLPSGHFGDSHPESFELANRRVIVMHRMVWTGKPPYPGCKEPPAEEILREYAETDLIATGDNHRPFVLSRDGRLLVNPGSLSRQTADQIDHRPRVYTWYALTNTVKIIYIPIDETAVTRNHIEKTEQRDERIEAFVSRLRDEWDVTVDFETNLERFFAENNVRQYVKDIIRKALENVNGKEPPGTSTAYRPSQDKGK